MRRSAPEYPVNVAPATQILNHFIYQTLPANTPMAIGFALWNRQHSIEQKHALTHPAHKILASGYTADIIATALKDIPQGGRALHHIIGHGEGVTCCQADTMVRVLSQNHNLDVAWLYPAQCIKNERGGRINYSRIVSKTLEDALELTGWLEKIEVMP